ncbi:MAG: class A beta-lactamase [Proteobacteria bacterium]|nr:class A beta-lactamase [Pseudomonadota bacterium]
MYIRFFLILMCTLVLAACVRIETKTEQNTFQSTMAALEVQSHSQIGLSAVNMETGKKLEWRADERFKMASTVKLPIAVSVLHLIETHKLTLDKMIRIEPYELVPGSGKMGYFLTKPGLELSIYNLLEPMIAISDNTASDILLAEVGGPQAVRQYLYNNGLTDIWIDRTILQLFLDSSGLTYIPSQKQRSLQDWKKRFDAVPDEVELRIAERLHGDTRDTTTPKAMTALLSQIQEHKILQPREAELLLEIMSHTENKSPRIGKLLPKEAKLMHKTGSWWGAVHNYANDVGIIVTPKGEHIAISVYTASEGGSSLEMQAQAIAEVANITYNALS